MSVDEAGAPSTNRRMLSSSASFPRTASHHDRSSGHWFGQRGQLEPVSGVTAASRSRPAMPTPLEQLEPCEQPQPRRPVLLLSASDFPIVADRLGGSVKAPLRGVD